MPVVSTIDRHCTRCSTNTAGTHLPPKTISQLLFDKRLICDSIVGRSSVAVRRSRTLSASTSAPEENMIEACSLTGSSPTNHVIDCDAYPFIPLRLEDRGAPEGWSVQVGSFADRALSLPTAEEGQVHQGQQPPQGAERQTCSQC